jgi:tetratricopeptide (TPR) repeat protein/tRNA A-37 threonylcarbamoyl transferase component Bud32
VIATVASIAKFFFGRSAGDDELGLPRDLSAEVRKRVKRLHQDGDIVGAAQLLYENRAFEAAAMRFSAANMPERAADAYEQAGMLHHAIDLYRALGQPDRVAQLHARQGDHLAAADQLLRLGQEVAAADALSRAGEFQKAAQIFTRHQQHTRAAKCFEDAGQTAQQMEALERQFKADLTASGGNLQMIQSSRHLARIAGEHFIASGQVQRGVTLLLQAQCIDEAAVALHRAGYTIDAAKLFEKYDRLQDAAEYYRQAQQPRLATLALARLSLSRGDQAHAARLFSEAQDYEQAAQILLSLDQPAAAADMLLRVKAYDRAALAFLRANQSDKAARCFEAANDHARAIDLYAQLNDRAGELRCALALGNHLRAAKLYIAHERLEDALAQAERVLSSHPDYPDALELQGDILSHLKRFDDAARAYLSAATLRRSDPALLFKHARCLEMLGQLPAAVQVYEQLLRLFPTFDKAQARLDRIRPRLQPTPAPAPTHGASHAASYAPALNQQGAGRPHIRSVMGVAAVPSPQPMGMGMGMGMGAGAAPIGITPPGAASLAPSAQQASFIQQQRGASAVLKQPIRRNPTPIHGARTITPQETPAARETQEPRAIHSAPGPHSQAPAPRGQSQEQSFLRTPSALARNPEAFNPSERPRYEVIEEIARGGMGVVYKARDTVLNRIVAYKILSESLKNNAQAVEYFIREARAAARLNHVSIVTVFDAGHQQGEYYMAMEYVNGRTLKDYVARQGPFPEKLVRFLLMHACRGLQYAHDSDIIHRDIKGGNMMLTNETKQLKIMDFGLAKVMTEVQRDANENTRAVGTPFYMSPEQILGDELDWRSDIYSLGVTFFELTTGTVPFFKGDVTYHHVHTPPPSPRSLNPAISEHLEAIILKAMAKRPQDRFADCNEMLKALK